VWLYALPERGRFGQPRILDRGDRVRVYYLSSSLAKSRLSEVEQLLVDLELANEFLARIRNNLVVILGKNGLPFRHLNDAEKAQRILETRASSLLSNLAVAFIETKVDQTHPVSREEDSGGTDLSLDELIASQADTTVTEGKCMILAVPDDDERHELERLFAEQMKIQVRYADSGLQVVQFVEDFSPDLIVVDSKLQDMHAWQLLGKLKEIGSLPDLPVIVITDEPSFGGIVAKVASLIIRPVAISRLRHSVWTVLHNKLDRSQPPTSDGQQS
jgi:hypothetical protein